MITRSACKNFSFTYAFVAILIAFTIFCGCEEPPDACFTPSVSLVDVNVFMSFENCTEPLAKSYLWSFDDGTTSTVFSPVHQFTAEGQYLVSLTAKGKVSSSDNVYKTLIKAGQRLISLAQIVALPSINPGGGTWDPNDNADIAVRFENASGLQYQSPTVVNAAWTFPMAVQMPSADLVLTPRAWTITVLDIDGGAEEIMAVFHVDFASEVPSGVLYITLDTAGSSMQINYTLR